MRTVIIYIVMAVLSLSLIGVGCWTFNQSFYNDKVRKYFLEKPVTEISNLANTANLSNKLVLVNAEVFAEQTFVSKNNKKVVLERYQEETKGNNNNWKTVKGSALFKVLPFKLRDKNNHTVLIDPYDLDKTFLGKPEETIENKDGVITKKSLWLIEPGQKIHVLGNIENKSGTLLIDSPNLYKSIIDNIWNKDPFIITTMEKTETANKAIELGKSIYYASLALFAAGIFFIISSISNITRVYKQSKNDNY